MAKTEKTVAEQVKEAMQFKEQPGAFVVVRGKQVTFSNEDKAVCSVVADQLRVKMIGEGHDVSVPEHVVRVGQVFSTEDQQGRIQF